MRKITNKIQSQEKQKILFCILKSIDAENPINHKSKKKIVNLNRKIMRHDITKQKKAKTYLIILLSQGIQTAYKQRI